MWVIRATKEESNYVYTVGFYDPQGKWCSLADFNSKSKAARAVNFLNGGPKDPDLDFA